MLPLKASCKKQHSVIHFLFDMFDQWREKGGNGNDS